MIVKSLLPLLELMQNTSFIRNGGVDYLSVPPRDLTELKGSDSLGVASDLFD